MDSQGPSVNSETQSEEENDMRRGPWTIEEDRMLVNYISKHGEGRWNSLARCAGLKRTGKSCRLRWLNYLRPDVRRGNITPEEQLLILQLHSRWGNRWSKIAQNLPGRTDNEIKNYWRTRVEKHAKQLKCDVNSKQFKDAMRYVWMPRLVERIQAAASSRTGCNDMPQPHSDSDVGCVQNHEMITQEQYYRSTTGGGASSSDSPSVDTTQNQMVCADHPVIPENNNTSNNYYHNFQTSSRPETLLNVNGSDFSVTQLDGRFGTGGDPSEIACWSMDDFWLLEQQLCSGL